MARHRSATNAQNLAARLLKPSRRALARHRRTRPRHLEPPRLGQPHHLTIVAIVSVVVAPIGLAVGCIAGYSGGWVDTVLMRITDLFLAFPSLILALAFVAALGPRPRKCDPRDRAHLMAGRSRGSRRAETLSLRNSDYVAAVRLMGASPARIVLRHIAPLCLPSVVVRVTLNMASVILTAAGLGFLGLGAQPPTPEWGAMVSTGRRFMLDSWWVVTFPGIAILVVEPGLQPRGRRAARRPRSAAGLACKAKGVRRT